jgi:hypothetical protein
MTYYQALRPELATLTGDLVQSLILNNLMNWQKSVGQTNWVSRSNAQMVTDLYNMVSPHQVSKALKSLIKKGFLLARNNPIYKANRTKQYQVNPKMLPDKSLECSSSSSKKSNNNPQIFEDDTKEIATSYNNKKEQDPITHPITYPNNNNTHQPFASRKWQPPNEPRFVVAVPQEMTEASRDGTNDQPQSAHQIATESLIKVGFIDITAEKLAKQYSLDEIEACITAARGAYNPTGYIFKALKHGWQKQRLSQNQDYRLTGGGDYITGKYADIIHS